MESSAPTEPLPPRTLGPHVDRWLPSLCAGLRDRAEKVPGSWCSFELKDGWTVSMVRSPKHPRFACKFSVACSDRWNAARLLTEADRLIQLLGYGPWERWGEAVDGAMLSVTYRERP